MRRSAVLLLCLWLAGCAGGDGGAGPAEPLTPPPTYAEVAGAHNARVGRVPRLWARIATTVWYPDEDGKEREEQFEGHLQVIRPDRVSLSFSKVGDEYAALGCNAESYWWVERIDEPRALVGTHEKATPERMRELGIPVYPLDLIELLGVTELPESGEEPRWSEGQVEVRAPVRSGTKRMLLDARTLEPTRVEILDGTGQVLVWSSLERYRDVDTPAVGDEPRVPGDAWMHLDDAGVRARIRISEPEARESRPTDAAFDLSRKLRAYMVRPANITSLDEVKPGVP